MADIGSFQIGAFVLEIDKIGAFVVVNFQLTKSIGKITSCTIVVSDYTQQVIVNNQRNFPKKLGSIKQLFQQSTEIQNTGKLYSCKLVQYRSDGQTRNWFLGKVCVITPILHTAYGVKAGMQCYCMGQACQLMFQPFSDFVYVPGGYASDIKFLQSVGVFKSGGITQALFASSKRPQPKTIITKGKIESSSTILYVLNVALNVLMGWNKISPQTKELSAVQSVDLNKYFTGGIKLSSALRKQVGAIHPYIHQLLKTFTNGFQNDTILDAIINTISSQGRYLTFVPSSMSSGQDLLQIIPAYIRKSVSQFPLLLTPQNMIGCSISANPLEHIKTPTYVYIRGKKLSAWQTPKNNVTDYDKTVGRYYLKGVKPPYRLQILDVPTWLLNMAVQSQQKQEGSKDSPLMSKSRKAQSKTGNKESAQGTVNELMNTFAKTVFFNRYMLNKSADISLAVNSYTIDIDSFLGDSLPFSIPIEAAELGQDTTGQNFYGVLNSVTYSFQAASTPTAKSNMGIRCSLSGVLAEGSQGTQDLYKNDGKNFIYEE